jgi:RNA polymerase sigma factor (TIGR02999 family)
MQEKKELEPEHEHEETIFQVNRLAGADLDSRERLIALLYPELKRIATAHMRRERPDHTLQPTALVNELYLHLLRRPDAAWTSRKHFLVAASQAMHRLLVDYARTKSTQKRGGSWSRLEIQDPDGKISGEETIRVLELDELLTRLAEKEPRMASVVELKFFGGLTFAEIGEALGVDERTAKRDWTLARVWLRGQLESDDGGRVGENQSDF